MTIETKFNVKQEVYFLCQNRLRIGKIYAIATTTNEQLSTTTIYHVNVYTSGGKQVELPEDRIFETKDALLINLSNQIIK